MQQQTFFAERRLPARNRPSLLTMAWGFVDWCNACAERHAQRRALAELDERLLLDIGRVRSEAMNEAAKPCWRR